jgi:hypothetical protein
MTVWILVMHLLMADGSVKTENVEIEADTLESCLDIGRHTLEQLHALNPGSTSGLHFCIKKDAG